MIHVDFTLVEIDMDLKKEKVKMLQIMVMVDHFTHFAQAFTLPNHMAQTVVQCLHERVFLIFGAPSKLYSDQGREFENQII